MKLFISWSKKSSKQIALALERFIVEFFRKSKSLDVYVSASKIDIGKDWLENIKDNITKSEICVIVMTDENEFSRWTHFEAGAIAFNTKSSNIIPFLVTTRDIDATSPLRIFQFIRNSPEEIYKLIKLIKKEGRLTGVRDEEFDSRFNEIYPTFSSRLSEILQETVVESHSSIPFAKVYPTEIVQLEPRKAFVGAAMASLPSSAAYEAFREEVTHVAEAIEICCSTIDKAYWGGRDVYTTARFDGEQVALLRDLGQLKSAQFCVFIVMESLPSSVLVEIGYAIGLNKRIVIFCKRRDVLPFLLRRADEQIFNVSIYECDNFDSIKEVIDKDGEAIMARRSLE